MRYNIEPKLPDGWANIFSTPKDWDSTVPYVLAREIMGWHKCPSWGAWSTEPMTEVNPRNNGTFKYDMDNVYGDTSQYWSPEHNIDQAMLVLERLTTKLYCGVSWIMYNPSEEQHWELKLDWLDKDKKSKSGSLGLGNTLQEAICDMAMNLLKYYPKEWAKANKSRKKK